jgi:superfamily II DNA or RNA helicase
MPKIYDNIQLKFADGLAGHLQTAKRVDYCVGYFNLRGWSVATNGIDNLTGGMVYEGDEERLRYCRLLVGMTKTPRQEIVETFADPERLMMDNARAKGMRLRLAEEFAEQLTIGTPTQKDEDTLKRLLHQLKTGRVVVKLFLKHQLHAKLYLAHQGNDITPRIGLLGSSNFTFAGLSHNGELNIDVIEQDAATKLENWFDDRWNDRWCIDVTKDLIDVLENSWVRPDLIPPFHIYLKMAYHLSREARAGLAEYKLPSVFATELLDFQQAAVKIAAHHLYNRQGVMIGDVVGLGKTITATAVAKIMEDDLFYNTLIVCPKNLVPMWDSYVYKYQLHAKVVSHSMITKDLPNLRRYKLVIIDESHNFRNNLGAGYRALRAYIAENDSKVILLSATPYNKTYLDLANQLKLFIGDDDDIGIRPERYIAALGGLVEFNYKHTDTPVKSIAAFEKSSFADDWRDVMRLYLVRRTRSFIKTNYAKEDSAAGRKYLEFANGEKSFFPDRKPKTVEFSLRPKDPSDQYASLYDDDTVNAINALNLPRYGLMQYEAEKPTVAATSDELRILQNLSRAGTQVLGFCRTNLYKRLESSGYAFCLSVSRHILRNHIFIYALENSLKLPVSSSVVVDMYADGDEDDLQLNLDYSWDSAAYAKAAQKYYHIFDQDMHTRFDWIRSELFDAKTLINLLRTDSESLLAILHKVKVWQAAADRKLAKLRNLIEQTHKREKVIVFTQFADTAEYLYKQLSDSGVKDIALALGGSDDIVDLVNRFSPVSNQVEHFDKKTELRVLITTDVLSEGQNLQDAHIIVNFDLPWAIVRLIQRAGRVDRIGQKSLEILCYSFLPEDGIERIIGLRNKLSTRIRQNAEVVGSDEMFFDGDPVNISDLYSEKSGILDEDEDTEVDLASYAYQIWKNAIDAYPNLQATIERMPNVVFSAKETNPDQSGSVIVYVKSDSDHDALAWLHENGEIAMQSQYAILKAAECAYDAPALEKLPNHHELVRSCVKQIQTETDTVTGTLGRKNSVKYRVYRQLERFHDENIGTLFLPPKLENALDEIFQNPLKESSIDTLSRQMKSGISDEKLAELVVSLYADRRLCNVTEDDNEYHVPQIICSLGLIGGNAR